MINDVLQACQKLNVKAIKALDFIDKWAAFLKRPPHPAQEEMDYTMAQEFSVIDDQFELIRFSKEVKRNPTKKALEEENQKNCKFSNL